MRNPGYQELGARYLERRRAEHTKRRCLKQLERLGFQVSLVPAADS